MNTRTVHTGKVEVEQALSPALPPDELDAAVRVPLLRPRTAGADHGLNLQAVVVASAHPARDHTVPPGEKIHTPPKGAHI